MSLKLHFDEKNDYECGVDEAGAGPLMGPVFAAAVIWNVDCPQLNDSKKLTPKKRKELSEYIKANATDWAIYQIDEKEIDEINILQARIKAMHKAIGNLELVDFIELLLIDGNRFTPYFEIPFEMVVKGDSKYQSIAAASILAKVAHDEYILQLHEKYPMYGWDKNMGYGTKAHREAIQKYGATPFHRKTFLRKIINAEKD